MVLLPPKVPMTASASPTRSHERRSAGQMPPPAPCPALSAPQQLPGTTPSSSWPAGGTTSIGKTQPAGGHWWTWQRGRGH